MNDTLARCAPIGLLIAASFVFNPCCVAVAQNDATPSDAESLPLPQSKPSADAPAASPAPVRDPFAKGEATSTQAPSEDYEVLMQGQVHEAFAAPIDSDPNDGAREIAKAPPEPVDEQPPEVSPEDQRMKWIPGYWSWSDEQDDYVWVSGLWRKTPPGQTWNPGYWSQTASGKYSWTSGYWASERTSPESANYLPVPPKSIDNGPSVQPPSDDYFWVPGHWEHADNHYRWRSGFWSRQQGDWIWQPESYVATPQGCLSVNGYWDYLPPDRGQLYAPVCFYGSAYRQPSYVYRPRYPLVNTAALLLNLFVRRGHSHYYYGDYHGSSYASRGYRPWYDRGSGHGQGAPWLGYYDRKYHKSGIDFVGSMHRYGSHVRATSKAKPQLFDVKRSAASGASRGTSGALAHSKRGRSLDEAVRSDVGRVAAKRSTQRPADNSGRTHSGITSGVTRSPVNSHSQGLSRGSSGGLKFPSIMQRSQSPLARSKSTASTPSVGRPATSNAAPTTGGSKHVSRSSGSKPTGASPTIRRSSPPLASSQPARSPSTSSRSTASAPTIQRSPSLPSSSRSFRSSMSIRRGPTTSSNSRSSSAPKTIQRSFSAPKTIQRSPSRSSSSKSFGSSSSTPRRSSPSISGGRSSGSSSKGGGGGSSKSRGFRGITGKK